MSMDLDRLSRLRDFANEVKRLIYQLVKNNESCDRISVARYGVTSSQGYTLLSLPDDGTLSMNELSKAMGVDNSTMTRMVDQLIDKALVHRNPDEKDRRQVRIGLTAKGDELREHLEQALQSLYKEALGEIGEEERLTIINGLKRLNEVFAKSIESCGEKCAVGRTGKISGIEREPMNTES